MASPSNSPQQPPVPKSISHEQDSIDFGSSSGLGTASFPGQPLAPEHITDSATTRVSPSQKKGDTDWFVRFNPRVPRVLDVDLVHTLAHNSVVFCVAFSDDGKYLATGCNESAQIYDVGTGNKVKVFQYENVDRGVGLYIRSVRFSPDGRYLATSAEDKQIRLWDIESRTIKYLFRGHKQDIYSLDFSKNGRYIASGSGDRTVRIWDVITGTSRITLTIEDGVTTVAISPDSKLVAAGGLDNCIRIWEIDSGRLIGRLEGSDRSAVPDGSVPHGHNEGHRDSVYSVVFTENGLNIISGSLDKTVKIWSLTSGGKPEPGVKTFEGHEDFVLTVAQTPGAYGPWIISGSKDKRVQFWDPMTGQAQLMIQGHKNSVVSVVPSPGSRFFATGSVDCEAKIWSYDLVGY
ncbi:Beta-TrCP [Dactylellina cionopaga]|nr:Beta-TrCP [Dactylellina cionopaga]